MQTCKVLALFLIAALSACGSKGKHSLHPAGAVDQPGIADLAAPGDLVAYSADQKVVLAWKESPGAKKYIVARGEKKGGPYKTLKTLTQTAFDDTGIPLGVTYYYVVRAQDDTRESANSAEVSAMANHPLAPAPVTATAVGGDQRVDVFWSAGPAPSGFQIQRWDGAAFATIATKSGASYADLSVVNGAMYQYRVLALNEERLPSAASPVTSATAYAHGRQLCVSSSLNDDLLVYPADATGGAPAPLRTIQAASSITAPIATALDPVRGNILVLDGATNDVLTFSTQVGVFSTPIRRLHGAWTSPKAITVDTVAGELYVAEGGAVYVYPVTDASSGTLLRSNTSVQAQIVAIALDTVHGELFTADATSVMSWFTTGSTLKRRYPWASGSPYYGSFTGLRAIAYIPTTDQLAVAEVKTSTFSDYWTMHRCYTTCDRSGTQVFYSSTSGGAPPNYVSMVHDGAHGELLLLTDILLNNPVKLYALKETAGTVRNIVLQAPGHVTSITASPTQGVWVATDKAVQKFDVASDPGVPLAQIGSVNGLALPKRLAVDPVNQEVYVYNAGSNGIAVFPWSSSGVVASSRSITVTNGDAFTGDMLYSAAHGKLYARAGTNSIVDFPRSTDGVLDWAAAERIAETPGSILSFAYDAAGDRIISDQMAGSSSFDFGFWGPALGTALFTTPNLIWGDAGETLLALDTRILRLSGTVFFEYGVSGSQVAYHSFYYVPDYGSSTHTSAVIDERNNEILLGSGGKIFVIPKHPSAFGVVQPIRSFDVSAKAGKDINAIAFCSQ